MCRSIKRLREGAVTASGDEVEAAARQYVRKVSGFQRPAAHNEVAFEEAVQRITAATEELLGRLVVRRA